MGRQGHADWQPNTKYYVDDAVYINDTQLWRCDVEHTSGAIFDPANWTLVADSDMFENIVYVNEKADFPTPAAGVITLAANTKYIINGNIVLGTDRIVLADNVVIEGVDPFLCSLVYTGTGALFTGTDTTFALRYLTLSAAAGSYYDLTNILQDKYAVVYYIQYGDTTSMGAIEGFLTISFDYGYYQGFDDGITFTDCLQPIWSRQFMSSPDCAGDFVTFAGTSQSMKVNNCLFSLPNVGDRGIVQDAGYTTSCGFITGNSFGGTGTPVVGFGPNVSAVLKTANKRVGNDTVLTAITDTEQSGIGSPLPNNMFWNTDRKAAVIYDEDESVFYEMTGSKIYTNITNIDWESGSFAGEGVTAVNNGVNDRYVGTADPDEGTYSAYISYDGGTSNEYNVNNAEISHFYFDVAIPAGATDVQVEFPLKCNGEFGYDYLRVYKAPTTLTPTGGSFPGAGAVQIGADLNNISSFTKQAISAGNDYAGSTMRLIFTWRNDNSVGSQPPANVGTINVNYI